jgi:hypothetical protein
MMAMPRKEERLCIRKPAQIAASAIRDRRLWIPIRCYAVAAERKLGDIFERDAAA